MSPLLRDILHLNIPDFPIALARLGEPGLGGRPVAVAAGHSDRALLQCVSDEARAEGVHEGMAVYRARRLCSALALIAPDPQGLSRGMRGLTEISGRFSPLWEPAAPGRLFLDLTGSARLLGPGRDVGLRLEREVAASLGLKGGVGVAGNKMVSRIASGYLKKPGVCDILRGSEGSFIAPLPVSALPGVGEARCRLLLQDLNLRRVGEVAALSVAQLRLAFGPFAPLLHQRAAGIDPSPVQLPRRSPEVMEESFLAREDNDDLVLLAELCRLVEACGLRLRRLSKGATRLSLSLCYADGLCEDAACSLPAPCSQDLPLLAAAEGLYERACSRRVRLRGMRLRCGGLGAESRQMDLFAVQDELPPRQRALQQALDDLRGRYGMDAVRRGRSLP